MSATKGLRTASRIMAWLSAAGFAIVPAMVIYAFLDPEHSRWMILDVDHLGERLHAQIPLAHRLAALGCALVPAAFTMWALWSLRRLFVLYAKADVFSLGALRALNHVAIALFWGVVAGFVMQAPISFLLSLSRGVGHREISLGFGSDDVAWLFVAGAVLVIARVMAEARRVADENAGFV